MCYENGEKKVIRDNYVIKMKDEKTIDAVYNSKDTYVYAAIKGDWDTERRKEGQS